MDTPAFSIVITTVDRPQLLLDAVRSVLGQTFTDFELIVVNDGGPDLDPLLAGIDPLQRVRWLRLPGKSGPGRARNEGVARANGRFLAFLDDDDLYHPDHLATLNAQLAATPEAVVYADAIVYRERIENGQRRLIDSAAPWQHELFIRQRLWIHNFIPVQTFAVARAAYLAIGGFDEALRAFEDWDLLLKLAAHHDFVHLPRITSEIRMRPETGAHRSQSVKHDRSEPEIIEFLYARHGDLDDPLVRLGRDHVRANQFARGPDFLIVDADDNDRRYRERLARACAAANEQPTAPLPAPTDALLLVVLAPAGFGPWLAATLASFARLPGDAHRLIVIHDAPLPPGMATGDPRVSAWQTATLDDFGELTRLLNEAVTTGSATWLAILPAGVTLAAHCAQRIAACAALHPHCQAIYSDHDEALLPQDIRARPAFKPDFDPELLAAEDYIGPALWLRRAAIAGIGGPGVLLPFPGNWLHDALWRLHDAAAGHIAHIPEVLIHLPLGLPAAPLQLPARQAVVEQHLAQHQPPARALDGPLPGTLRVDYPLPEPAPRISLIVWHGTAQDDPARCVSSVIERTDLAGIDLEIIVGGADLLPPSVLGAASQRKLSIRRPPIATTGTNGPAAAINAAAEIASGAVLMLLAASTEVIDAAWLKRLLGQVRRTGIGAAGGRLLAPDGTVAGGAIVLGLDGAAGPAFIGQAYRDTGYMNRLQLAQTMSAVSAHCLAVSRLHFHEAGGFNAVDYPDCHADVDFCLRLGRQNRRTLWDPQIIVADHAPTTTRAADSVGDASLRRHWATVIATDPAYNPNLSRSGGGFSVAT